MIQIMARQKEQTLGFVMNWDPIAADQIEPMISVHVSGGVDTRYKADNRTT